ncbi:uncharacterized protein LOC105699589 [Orussus abietinus]|uniref:uncharacterized protein LOC105699589 n=1 Tax=Orussus abietinus TaxID=222816 RepID=UPI0006265E79|nr:uncharacterized protein LOC105699589 [Orussus abietinus]
MEPPGVLVLAALCVSVLGTTETGQLAPQQPSVSTTAVGGPQRSPCRCALGVCSCCSRILLTSFDQKACVNVTYDPDEFSFTAKVLMNDRILYTRTVSGKNPRPFCVPVPRIPAVRACVRFYNVYFQGRNVHLCMNLEGKFSGTTLFKVGLDCMRMGSQGFALVKPEDGGGLGQVELLPGDDDADDYDGDSDEDDDDEDDEDDLLDY